MSENNTYNGWHNYATWRVSLEVFDGMEIDKPYTWEMCRDYVEDIIEQEVGSDSLGITGSYAHAFINDVAWGEIAEHLNEKLEGCI